MNRTRASRIIDYDYMTNSDFFYYSEYIYLEKSYISNCGVVTPYSI